MRVLLLGDLHLEESPMEGLTKGELADVDWIVQTGDCHHAEEAIDWLAETGINTLFVPGNHEHWRTKGGRQHLGNLVDILDQRARGTKVLVLQERQVDIGNLSFVGATLWTDLGLNAIPSPGKLAGDFAHIQCADGSPFGMTEWQDEHDRQRHFFQNSLFELHQRGRRAIAISHHFPSIASYSVSAYDGDAINETERWRWYGSELDHFLDDTECWFHGHTHLTKDYWQKGCRVCCNPRGYSWETDQKNAFRRDYIVDL